MDSDSIKKKAEELAERLKSSDSQNLKKKADELAEQIKNKTREFSSGDRPQSDDSLEQAKNKIREVLGGAKKPSPDPSNRESADQRDLDDHDDENVEEEAASRLKVGLEKAGVLADACFSTNFNQEVCSLIGSKEQTRRHRGSCAVFKNNCRAAILPARA